MSTFLKRQSLSRPAKGKKIELFDLAYVRARNRNKVHSTLLEVFEKCGLTKSDLAKMLNKRPEQLTRLFGGPGNLTLDTLSDLVFAMRGDFMSVELIDEISKAKSNNKKPEWIKDSTFRGYQKSIQTTELTKSQWVVTVKSPSRTVSKVTSDEVKYEAVEFAS